MTASTARRRRVSVLAAAVLVLARPWRLGLRG
jgi:hypothetical protein